MKESQRTCYLDNASTSYPKPESVVAAVNNSITSVVGGYNRSSNYKSVSANFVDEARLKMARLINCEEAEIYFNSGATESINQIIMGLLKTGDHVITSPWEHNAVTRPLNQLKNEKNVKISVCTATLNSGFDYRQIETMITKETRLVIVNHVSNVLGLVAPIEEIGLMVAKYPNVAFAVDASQSIGCSPINVKRSKIDFLAFPGHKALRGPNGIGGFFLSNRLKDSITPIKFGGTGVSSHEQVVVDRGAHKFEVGTPNTMGLSGLNAALDLVGKFDLTVVEKEIRKLTSDLVHRLSKMDHVITYLPRSSIPQGLVTINVPPLSPKDLSSILYDEFGIITRDGLHCSINAHKIAGTYPEGSVRISIGKTTTEEDIDYLCSCLELIK
ncbi:hypothetical protein ST37_10045 [Vibrio sp. qd031]|uniref:aminotransferase class V-fold PLP-dependent enzyme n=1 Tax=Vibrio sp. qd031 TaxID=1603038 RepID=UPI000A2565D3|nr:aminotransferase class V-fold PLP-dependent enzyme [Vibrio sp. qd031]ORT50229.1 hypothetical protein ST37_10045 [Vibrio sp. qd031]